MRKLSKACLLLGLASGCGSASGAPGGLDDAGPDDAGPLDAALEPKPEAAAPTETAPAACSLALHYGHGAAVVANNWSSAELAVRVICAGELAPGRSIGWSLVSGDGVLGASASAAGSSATETDTDAAGIARVVYRHPSGFSQPSWSNLPGQVRATLGTETVELFVTAFNPGQSSPLLPQANIVFPAGAGNGANLGSGKANTVIVGALRVAVVNAAGVEVGQGAPNVGIRVFGANDDALHCVGEGYTALTDDKGLATCDLQLPATPGEHVFDLDVGRVLIWQGLRVTVVP